MKKSSQRRGDSYDSGFLDSLPWRREREIFNEPPPGYERGDINTMQNAGFYGSEKLKTSQRGGLTRANTGASQRSFLPQNMAPGSVVMIPMEEYAALSHNQNQSPIAGTDTTMASRIPDHTRQISEQSTPSSSEASTRSRMLDPFFNQSELARQPSDAYNPGQRQVYRASELSSLSSGFGDGDIIIPDLPKPPQASMQMRESSNLGRFSWVSRGGPGDRETIYTTTSEDRPARYRGVNSWVNQQAGRIKRAAIGDRDEEEIPAVPGIPKQAQTNPT
ncbi:uncharacterized protein BCR38DRAFT_229864 [Pseudomassariella vexata]|uniref:Pal1 cell morphology protein-domain-containing protein n=1 Tax=Pseudomassariella vexata TaxID=1141098 RepID=A0A1Y2DWP3_9PEZI|nr:uncharacterized protein BCR38DRAFT_229864 [Pseudomassariella vexata]ORY63524.1 hypothetical protein BCR38DRAFT_229864 [Pseudomassariella vexata]